MLSRFQVVPAAYVLIRRAGEVLLQLRRNTNYYDGYWACGAAGHVEAGESVLEAAVREAHEELGVTIETRDLAPLCAMHRTHANRRPIDERVDFFFECWTWDGNPQRVEAQKAADLRWFSLTALPDDVVPHERFVMDRLREDRLAPIVTYGF
ncbi:MAG: NUDIX hydrolase [Nocardioidaceae bacterium]